MRSSDSRLAWLNGKKVALISGGPSNESDVSKRSAKNVANALQQLGINFIELDPLNPEFFSSDFDIAFNCLHGRWGEDGALQGYCDLKGIKYTGPGIKATTIGFDKQLFKHNIHRLGIHTPAIVDPSDKPFIIKPNSDGSSIGIHLIKSLNSYHELVKKQPELLSSDYFFEEFIDGVEVTSGVIKIDNQVKVLPILQIQTKNDFYDLDAKYTPGKTSFILPANISPKVTKEIELISSKIYEHFECKGCIRIDMMIKNDTPYVLEMNTNPGLTELSDIPAQAKHAGIDFNELMIHYLESAKQ